MNNQRQRKWNIHEAAILLDGYLQIRGGKKRKEVIVQVSKDLRQMAINQGEEIDDTFRNENGISFKLDSMESAYMGHVVSMPSTRIYSEIAQIYKNDNEEYSKILREAKAMINKTSSCEDDFRIYLSSQISRSKMFEIYPCYAIIEKFAWKEKILDRHLFETTDYKTVHNIQQVIETDKRFCVANLYQRSKSIIAGQYYLAYVQEKYKKQTEPQVLLLDFANITSLANTKPLSFSYFGEKKLDCSSWKEVYVALVAALHEDYPQHFSSGMRFGTGSSRVELVSRDKANIMAAPKLVPGTDLVIETNMSAASLVRKIKYLLDLCMVDYENVEISYTQKGEALEAPKGADQRADSGITNSTSLEEFRKYLIDEQKLSNATSNAYAYAIEDAEYCAMKAGLVSYRLYSCSREEMTQTATLLLKDDGFNALNEKRGGVLKRALVKLMEHMNVNVQTDSEQQPTPESPRTASHIEDSHDDSLQQPTSSAPKMKTVHHNEPYDVILKEYFFQGFRMNSTIEIRRFKKFYEETHGAAPNETDEEIVNIVQRLCIVYKERAYLPEAILSNDLKEKVLEYIDASFENGKMAIYYQALCAEFAEEFLEYPLYNEPELLKDYLATVGDGRFCINRNNVSKEANVTLNPLEEIRTFLIERGRPVVCEEIFSALSHLPQNKVKSLLAANAEFISNGQGCYFHESAVQLTIEDLECIASLIENIIAEKEFIGGNELYDALAQKYPYMIDENQDFSVKGFRDALKVKLGSRFSFKKNIISAAGRELNMSNIFATFAKNHDNFTMQEVVMLADELASSINFDAIYENSLRINKEQFVSKEQAQFAIEDTDAALDRVCEKMYIPIKEVTNFAVLPYAGFSWNVFLLEHFANSYSKKYILVSAGHNRSECVGAIVKRTAGIVRMDDLIVDILINTDVELKKESVLQFLVDEGYLAQRRYSNIEEVIIRAKAQRNRREAD